MKNIIRNFILTIVLSVPTAASAQFYVTGDDPGGLKWNYIDTDSYRIIYPQGTDSLARVYGTRLETFKVPVSRTSGYITGEGDGRLMPVVLHTYNTSNGSVAWAPKRMDLFTVPSAYSPEPFPWSTMLAVHESRHVTQMQFGMTGYLKYGTWLFGEMFNILASLLYPGMAMIEGDAVIAETALTQSGRGRTADFLNYYRVAFDNGDKRSWKQWRYGSQKNYTPSYYALGYLTLGGFRYLYDCPDFTSRAYHIAADKPYDFGAFYTVTREVSGKSFDEAFQEVKDTVHALWTEDARRRAPFMYSAPVTDSTRHYTDYTSLRIAKDGLYAVKRGFVDTPSLVKINPDGTEAHITGFSYQAGNIKWSQDENRFYWSESIPDPRWTMKTGSVIRYMDIDEGMKRSLTDGKEMLYNPVSGKKGIISIRYHVEGGSSIVVSDRETGETIDSMKAPDGMQIVEIVQDGDMIYATAISDDGYGIYRIENGGWETVLAPVPVMIRNLDMKGKELVFSSDRIGVNELYHLDPSTGKIRQMTNLRYGGYDFTYSENGKVLYYSSQTVSGKRIFMTPADSLHSRSVDFSQRYTYPIAEKMAAQEKEVAIRSGADSAVPRLKDIKISEPKKYSKAGHMFNIHSWAPVYVSVNRIMNMSFENIWQAASPGVTAIMQNRLSTAVGEFGYSASPDPYNPDIWRHSGHARFTYSGLYPVIEASVDFNDRDALQYRAYGYLLDEGVGMEVKSTRLASPSLQGKIAAYIPWNFSRGEWYKGLIPRISYTLSNDRFDTGMVLMSYRSQDGSFEGNPVFMDVEDGTNPVRQSISGSVRGYAVMGTPNSAVYPRWGAGLEIGASSGFESYRFLSPMGYVYAYGYIPGFTKTQGFRLSATWQKKLLDKSFFSLPVVDVLPRGLSGNPGLSSWISIRNESIFKLTADYAVPIYIGDVSIGGSFFYVKRLLLKPHFDYTFLSGNNGLLSAGGEFLFDLNSILWLEWPCSIGATYSYNGGNAFESTLNGSGLKMDRHHLGFVFNVSF